jgi:DNA-binding transcriptional MerR regulator
MSTQASRAKPQAPPQRLLTIGTVCRRLKSDFPDISISKIRYLEDQGLLTPRRTQGGYRLFGEEDVERLRRILELQRDEFLPLRVIRQELASPSAKERKRRHATRFGMTGREDEVDLESLCAHAGITPETARELEEFGLLSPRVEAGERLYTETDVDLALACGKLGAFGIAPRHLRAFRTAADREAGLLEAVVAPSLRSRNPERRQQAVDDLQTLGELAHDVAQLLFWRELRRQAAV